MPNYWVIPAFSNYAVDNSLSSTFLTALGKFALTQKCMQNPLKAEKYYMRVWGGWICQIPISKEFVSHPFLHKSHDANRGQRFLPTEIIKCFASKRASEMDEITTHLANRSFEINKQQHWQVCWIEGKPHNGCNNSKSLFLWGPRQGWWGIFNPPLWKVLKIGRDLSEKNPSIKILVCKTKKKKKKLMYQLIVMATL